MSREPGKIHHAKLDTSPRLQRLHAFLSDGNEHTTREIDRGADICAVSTAVVELRLNGYVIDCRTVAPHIYAYRMTGKLHSIIREICMYCKKHYATKDGHGVTGDSHGICPKCYPGELAKAMATRVELTAQL